MANRVLPHQITAIAAEARLDPGTVRTALTGKRPAFLSTRHAIAQAVERLGLTLPPDVSARIHA